MHPGPLEVVAAAVTALEDVVAPAVRDEHAESTLRTAVQLLRSTRVRLEVEQQALAEECAELRALLELWQVRLALAAVPAPAALRYPARAEQAHEAAALRSALAAAIDAVPDPDHPFRVAARDVVQRSVDRQQPWLVDAFTGPRR